MSGHHHRQVRQGHVLSGWSEGQQDDITQKTGSGGVVYQVKWSKGSVKKRVTWLENAIAAESENIKARVKDGATRYVLMTSVPGTAAPATGPNHYGAGTMDKLDETLAEYAREYGLDSMECWWRDDIDALVSALPRSVLYRFQKMLAGPEAMRFLLDADKAEAARRQAGATGPQSSPGAVVAGRESEVQAG